MDKQTLEYMKVRVDKGISLMTRTDALKLNIERALRPSIYRVKFVGDNDVILEISKGEQDFQTLSAIAITQFYAELAKAEIERLEQELAEL